MKIKSTLMYGGLGVLAYLIFLVTSFPIEHALKLVRGQMQGVYAQTLTGTVWRGRAAKIQVQDQAFERVSWDVKLLSVALGQLEIDVAFSGNGRKGQGTLALGSDGSLSLINFTGSIPISEIDHYFNLPVDIGGLADVKLDKVSLMGESITYAEGQVRWKSGKVTSPLAIKLGDFLVTLSTDEAGIKGVLKDEGGPVDINGIAQLSADNSYTFSGKIAPRGGQNSMLAQGIRALGRAGPDGRIALEYSGKL